MATRRGKPTREAATAVAVELPVGRAFDLCLLGQPRFTYDGKPFAFASFRKTLQLLAYLLMRDAAADREALAFLFWPDDEEETSLANLRRNLHLLHQHLPPSIHTRPWILSAGSTLGWNEATGARLDVREFERACDERRFVDAVAIYRGDLLEHLYDEWIVPERERLRRRFEDAVRVLIAEHRSRREFAVALGYAERLLATDPWREDLVRVCIAMRYESGDRAGALAAFREFAKELREEMDVDPMPETIALRDAIIDDADVGEMTGLVAREAAPAPRHVSDLPFVGREPEFAQLRTRYDRAVAGEGGACALCGEAGIGKTRAVTELMHVAESQGTRVLIGTTTSPESVPYQAFVSALRPMVPLLAKSRLAPVWLAALATLLPSLAALRTDLPVLDAGDHRRDRRRLYEGLAVAFEELARARPLLVIIEDLHWAGAATVHAFEALRDRLSQRRVLFVATFRDDEIGAANPVRALRRRADPLETIALGRLPRSAIAELAGAGVASSMSAGDVERFFDRAEGHPLFLLDLIVSNEGDDDDALPPAIEDAIERRLEGVEPKAQLYLDIAATIGAAFDVETIVAVAGGSEREAEAAIETLIARHTLRRTSGRGGSDFAFTHHLIQRVAYERVDERSRARLHRRIARFSSERDGTWSASAALIAHHYAAGGELELAAEAFAHASSRAERLAANAEAAALAERGLELTSDAHRRISLLFALERLAKLRGEVEKRASILERLRDEVAGAGLPAATGELLAREMSVARERSDRDAELTIIAQLDQHAAAHEDPSIAAVAARARADHARSGDRFDLAIPHAEEALAFYREARDSVATIDMLCAIGHAASMLGNHEHADRTLDEAATLVRNESSPAFEARVLLARAAALAGRQHYAEAAVVAEQAAELFAEGGDFEGEAQARDRLGSALARVRRFDEASAAYVRAQQLYRAIDVPRSLAGSLINAAMVTISQHDYHRAEESLDEAVPIFKKSGDARGLAISQVNRAFVLLQQERPIEAEAAARASLSYIAESHLDVISMSALQNLASALYEQGRYDEAMSMLERAIEFARAHDRLVDLADTLSYLVMTALDRGDLEIAREGARELETILGGDTPVSERYLAYWALARCAYAAGDAAATKSALAWANREARAREREASNEAGRAMAAGRRFVVELHAATERGEWPGGVAANRGTS